MMRITVYGFRQKMTLMLYMGSERAMLKRVGTRRTVLIDKGGDLCNNVDRSEERDEWITI